MMKVSDSKIENTLCGVGDNFYSRCMFPINNLICLCVRACMGVCACACVCK